jgi:hypothetical protein
MAKPLQFSVRTILFGMTGVAVFASACTAASVLPFVLSGPMLVVVYVTAWATTGASFGVDQSETVRGLAFGVLAGLVVGCVALYPVMAVWSFLFAFGHLLTK